MAQQENVQQKVKITINDLIYTQVKDLGRRMDRLENRMDKLEERLDTTRRELNARMDKIYERIDMNTLTSHGQITNISTIGIAIAVIYSLLR